MQLEIRFKKCGSLTSRMFASLMIRVFPSLEYSAGHVRIPEDNLQDFCVCPLLAPDNRWHKCHLYVEQNITARSRCLRRHLPYFQQQMPASFGSRGFILSVKMCHQGHQKVRPLSPVCRTCTRRIFQTWKRHGIRCKHSAGRNAHIFLQRISICISI